VTTTKKIIDQAQRFMSPNYPRYPIAMVHGQGCCLTDADGKQYLDLFAGFGAGLLGHCHHDLVAAVTEQANQLWHPGNLVHSEPQIRAAEAIARFGFGGRSFFCHSGADANEAAIKLARLYGKANPGSTEPTTAGRYKLISMQNSFHGRSFATMGATGQAKVSAGYEPLLTGYSHVPFNDIEAIERHIDGQTVAVIIEPIQGEGGINVPDDDYLPSLRRLCDKHDLLLICDEVWTGCGRTGRYFAHQHWNIEPDIMTLGKGVGGGLAVGVMCAKPQLAELYDAVKQGGVKHATTLGGNCISMAATAAVFKVLDRDKLVSHAEQLGKYAVQRLCKIARQVSSIRNVRGKGLFIGIELDKPGKDIVDQCMQQGILINCTGEVVLRLAPPLVISQEQLDRGLNVIEDVLRQ